MKKERFFFKLILLFLLINLKAQQPYTAPMPFTIPAGQYFISLPQGQFCCGDILLDGTHTFNGNGTEVSQFQTSNNAIVEFQDYRFIHIQAEQTAGTGFLQSGSFHARINADVLEIASFHPNGWDNIGRWDRFEVGVKLPASIDLQVEDFLNNSSGINPYDPDQIILEADFKNLTTMNTFHREGFYYREIAINGNTYTPSKSDYPFRVRLAPQQNGVYSFSLNLKVNNVIVATFTNGFFIVNESGKRGWLRVGNNNHLVDASGNDFFAIGQDYGPLNNIGSEFDPVTYDSYRNKIMDLHNKGGNMVRILMEPGNFYMEWEEAGVYGSNRPNRFQNNSSENFLRQFRAYELDKIFETCESNNVWVQLGTEDDQLFAVPPCPYFGPCWPNHPYSTLLQNVVPEDWIKCFDIANNPNIFEYHKRKLRYINARFGYSSNLGIWETCNEFSGLGANASNAYTTTPATRDVALDWATNVADYLAAFYPFHIRTLSYPDISFQNPQNTQNPTCCGKYDIRSAHSYSHGKDMTKNRFDQSRTLQSFDNWPAVRRPVLFGEMGVSDGWEVDNCFDTEFHNGMWVAGMSGATGAGLYRYAWARDELRDHIIPIKDFFDNIPFQSESFGGTYDKEPDVGSTEMEAFYNVNAGGSKAFGWIHNYDYYWAGVPDYYTNPSYTCQINPPSGQQMEAPSAAGTHTQTFGFTGFQSSTDYIFEQWNCYGNGGFEESLNMSSNVFGTIHHTVTLDDGPGGAYDPDIAFKLYKNGENFRMASNNQNNDAGTIYLKPDTMSWSENNVRILAAIDSSVYHHWDFGNGVISDESHPMIAYKHPGTYTVSYSTLNSTGSNVTYVQSITLLGPGESPNRRGEWDDRGITVFPNPGSGIFDISYKQGVGPVILTKVVDNYGRVIREYTGAPETIDISIFSQGIYQLIFLMNNTIISKKVIITK